MIDRDTKQEMSPEEKKAWQQKLRGEYTKSLLTRAEADKSLVQARKSEQIEAERIKAEELSRAIEAMKEKPKTEWQKHMEHAEREGFYLGNPETKVVGEKRTDEEVGK